MASLVRLIFGCAIRAVARPVLAPVSGLRRLAALLAHPLRHRGGEQAARLDFGVSASGADGELGERG